MPRTRAQGTPDGGYQQLDMDAKRTRTPKKPAQTPLALSKSFPGPSPPIVLTDKAAQTPAKRARDDDDSDSFPSQKRVASEQPQRRGLPLFRRPDDPEYRPASLRVVRNRRPLTPYRKNLPKRTSFDPFPIKTTETFDFEAENSPVVDQAMSPSQKVLESTEIEEKTQEPARSTLGSIWNTAKGWLSGTPIATPRPTPATISYIPARRSQSPSPAQRQPSSETVYPSKHRLFEHQSVSQPSSPSVDRSSQPSKRQKRTNFQQASVFNEEDVADATAVEPDFDTAQILGTNKRRFIATLAETEATAEPQINVEKPKMMPKSRRPVVQPNSFQVYYDDENYNSDESDLEEEEEDDDPFAVEPEYTPRRENTFAIAAREAGEPALNLGTSAFAPRGGPVEPLFPGITPKRSNADSLFPTDGPTVSTPLKSALKSANGKSVATQKAVGWSTDPVQSRKIYSWQGPPGDYRGSLFSRPVDNSFNTDSSPSTAGGEPSPHTKANTVMNMQRDAEARGQFAAEVSTPTPANRSQGFECPSISSSDNSSTFSSTGVALKVTNIDASMFDDEGNLRTDLVYEQGTPHVPRAPRPAHAELPDATPSFGLSTPAGNTTMSNLSDASSLTDGDGETTSRATPFSESQDMSTLDEAATERLLKARQEAKKYTPKTSSRLSNVEQARSRSSSPPLSRFADDEDTQTASAGLAPVVSATLVNGIPATYFNQDSLFQPAKQTPDKTLKGPDGMTDYEREHQYDDWAANLGWPEPQTYVEAGVCSEFIDGLLKKKRNQEDDKRTHEWWQQEFAEVDKAMEDAKMRGLRLELVVD